MDGYKIATIAWIVILHLFASAISYFAAAGVLFLACKVFLLDVWSWKLSTIVWVMMWLSKPSGTIKTSSLREH